MEDPKNYPKTLERPAPNPPPPEPEDPEYPWPSADADADHLLDEEEFLEKPPYEPPPDGEGP